jgi:hypothetical protein
MEDGPAGLDPIAFRAETGRIEQRLRRLFLKPDARHNSSELNFAPTPATIDRMLELLIVIVRAFTLALRGHRELVLENLALRQQLAAFHRTTRCRLRARDRLFWMALARSWRDWRTALMIVQPDTIIRWHRDRLRRRWTQRSQRRPDGRPPLDRQIRTLVREMATANPLWGAPRIHGELRPLGVDVSERTVSRLLEPHPPPVAADVDDVSHQSPRGRPTATSGGPRKRRTRRRRCAGHQCGVSTPHSPFRSIKRGVRRQRRHISSRSDCIARRASKSGQLVSP